MSQQREDSNPPCLSLKGLIPPIMQLLASSNSAVSSHAISILIEMYRQFGENLRNDLLKQRIPQQRLRQIFERFDRIQSKSRKCNQEKASSEIPCWHA
ncbi:hypothetical protein GJ496_007061 [Pomphorhynchus laevis]|nr:hypothetical protein GJ496_007061 [Pomphorhynchus laevis]